MRNLFIASVATIGLLAGTVNVHAQTADSYTSVFVPFMVTDPERCEDPGLVTKNKDIQGLVLLGQRQKMEISTSASAQVPDIQPNDRSRLDSYVRELEAYQAQINVSAPSDYPATHVLWYCLPTIENTPPVSSQAILDILILYNLLQGELISSSSSNMPADLREPDNTRLTMHIDTIKEYLAYLDAAAPQDYPRTNAITKKIEETGGIGNISSAGR